MIDGFPLPGFWVVGFRGERQCCFPRLFWELKVDFVVERPGDGDDGVAVFVVEVDESGFVGVKALGSGLNSEQLLVREGDGLSFV